MAARKKPFDPMVVDAKAASAHRILAIAEAAHRAGTIKVIPLLRNKPSARPLRVKK